MKMQKFTTRFMSLPLKEKAVFLGSFLLVVSTVLPWYNDLDRFNYGDSFLGITGPLYLAGFLVLFSAGAIFSLLVMKLMGRALPKLPLTETQTHIAGAGMSLLMLILTNSVYFHAKFGVNLSEKNMGIGMYLAFFGVALIIAGVALATKKIVIYEEEEAEELIDMSERKSAGIEVAEEDIESMINNIQKTTNDIHDKQY